MTCKGRTRFLRAALYFCTVTSIWLERPLAADEARPPFSVVFYNLKNYLAMDRRIDGEIVNNAPKPPPEVDAVIEALISLSPDILAVCEIGDETYLDDLQSRLEQSGLHLPHRELVTASNGQNRNLAVLSAFPIKSRSSRDDYFYHIDGRKLPFQRGVLDVTLKIDPEFDLRLLALHFKSKRDVPEADQALMRLSEARIARHHIDRILAENPAEKLLVLGDLNDLRISAPVKALQGSYGEPGYLSTLKLSDPYGFRWTHHWAYADSYSRIDYALFNKALSPHLKREESLIYHWTDWYQASDHRPILVKITP